MLCSPCATVRLDLRLFGLAGLVAILTTTAFGSGEVTELSTIEDRVSVLLERGLPDQARSDLRRELESAEGVMAEISSAGRDEEPEAVELVARHCFAGWDAPKRAHFRFRVALSEALLGRRCVSITEVIGKGKSQRLFSEAPLEVAGPYAAEDADVTLRLDAVLRPKVDELGLRGELGQQLLEHHLLLEALHPDLLAEEDGAHPSLGEIFDDDVAICVGLDDFASHDLGREWGGPLKNSCIAA